jgi:pSer/pThr/pTyr-binding forkhead associated (FHA) protein
VAVPAPAGARWRLVVTIDPTLDTEPDPAAPPPNEPERVFPVEQDEMLVGRRDDRQQIRPAVALHDPGASRRHAKVIRNGDGSVALHDLGSTNGTKINGQDVVSGAVQALAEGDVITLGRWTRIRLEARK